MIRVQQSVCPSCQDSQTQCIITKQISKSIKNNHSKCLSILYSRAEKFGILNSSQVNINILNTLRYNSMKCFEYLFHYTGLRLPENIRDGFIMSASVEFIEYVIVYDSTFTISNACKIAKKLGRVDVLMCLKNMTYLLTPTEEKNLNDSLPSIRNHEPTYVSSASNEDICACNKFLDNWIAGTNIVYKFLTDYYVHLQFVTPVVIAIGHMVAVCCGTNCILRQFNRFV